jgi:hypothetical protein
MDSGTAASPASTVCDRGPASTVMRKWNRSTPWRAAPNSTGKSKKRDWARSDSRYFACLRGRDWESTETSTLRPARPPVRSKWTRNRTQPLYARSTSGTIPFGGREGAVRTVFPTVYRKGLNNRSIALYPIVSGIRRHGIPRAGGLPGMSACRRRPPCPRDYMPGGLVACRWAGGGKRCPPGYRCP